MFMSQVITRYGIILARSAQLVFHPIGPTHGILFEVNRIGSVVSQIRDSETFTRLGRCHLCQGSITQVDNGKKMGISSQVLPSKRRPVLCFLTPPHCLKKKGVFLLTHWFLI